MGYYFDDSEAVYSKSHGDITHTLSVLAGRYMGANLETPYLARPFTTYGIIRNKDYRYEFDGNTLFPDATDGSYVYAWGKLKWGGEGKLRFLLIPYGPVKLWMNGEKVYETTFESERYAKAPVTIDLPVKAGWNHLVLRFTKTKAGFGAEYGTWLGKLAYYFMHGRDEYETMEGFDYTAPTREHIVSFPPDKDAYEAGALASQILPLPTWTAAEESAGVLARLFADDGNGAPLAGKRVVARSRFTTYAAQNVTVSVKSQAVASVYIDGAQADGGAQVGAGDHQLLAILTVDKAWNGKTPLDFAATVTDASGRELTLENPLLVDNIRFPWLFAGAFDTTPDSALIPFSPDALVGEGAEKTWWRIDLPGGWVRLYNDNALWGHWDYPLGVTLYGLIETGRCFAASGKGDAIGSYVERHVRKSVATFDYAMFDRDHFGGATAVHHLLASIDSLDDCGSFGSLMLETAKDRDIGNYAPIADYVGNHICNIQARLEDGAFWRKEMMHHFHNGTMWADDLYMSVPFLCRYAAFKKDSAILDDAARQFAGFKNRLYMPNKKIMAHVYDFRRDMNTGVPWGRGNGWTIFSLSELLQVLPADHKARPELLTFFRELAEGYLALQDESGMWHQVLDMPESYPESSCTSMFICAYSRGIRNGWFEGDTAKYRAAAMKAWNALERIAIDKKGNLYGVCRGSEFAFNPRYYSEHLLPQLNNTHGIGITLLAGVEMLKLNAYEA